jgi:hypothetical protein
VPPAPAYRHDALLRAAWTPYGPLVSARPGEPLADYVTRVKAAVDPRDEDVPQPVREAVAALIGLSSASAMSRATGANLLAFLGSAERN